jgi:outer membrane protease
MRRLTTSTVLIGISIFLLIPTSGWSFMASTGSQYAQADNEPFTASFALDAGMQVENGNMTYTIQGPEDGGWKSELEWPLDNIVYGGGVVSVNPFRRWQINAGVWKDLGDDAGTLKDSDWFEMLSTYLYSLTGDSRAVYGEFDATVDAVQFDVNLRYAVLERPAFILNALVGYSYKKWEWTAGNGYQTSAIADYDIGSITGTGITYEEKLKIPYIGIALAFLPKDSPLGANLSIRYSPFTQCDDVDDHLARYKKSTGETTGSSFGIGGDLSWHFGKSWSLTGTINYESYDLSGDQDQYFYAGEEQGTGYSDIDMSVTGHQFSFGALLGYRF